MFEILVRQAYKIIGHYLYQNYCYNDVLLLKLP